MFYFFDKGEAGDKYVAVVSIHKDQFKLQPIQLQTVRPFLFEEISLLDSGIVPEQLKTSEEVCYLLDFFSVTVYSGYILCNW